MTRFQNPNGHQLQQVPSLGQGQDPEEWRTSSVSGSCSKLLIHQSINDPTLYYGHALWVMIERMRSQIQGDTFSFLCRVSGLSLQSIAGSESDPLLLHRDDSDELARSLPGFIMHVPLGGGFLPEEDRVCLSVGMGSPMDPPRWDWQRGQGEGALGLFRLLRLPHPPDLTLHIAIMFGFFFLQHSFERSVIKSLKQWKCTAPLEPLDNISHSIFLSTLLDF